MDQQVRLQTDLRDPSREGGCVCFANHLHPRETACGSGWRHGDHRSAIVTAVEMEHIVTTKTLQMQTPVQGLEMAVPCTL